MDGNERGNEKEHDEYDDKDEQKKARSRARGRRRLVKPSPSAGRARRRGTRIAPGVVPPPRLVPQRPHDERHERYASATQACSAASLRMKRGGGQEVHLHSARKERMGSTRAARRAGAQHASAATPARSADTQRKVSGS